MKAMNIKWVASFVLMVAVFALSGGSWSSVFAGEMTMPNCIDAYAGGPDFLFNAKPENLEIAYGADCLSEVSMDYGPTFLVNANTISSGSSERLAECPQVQSGAPTFLVNAEPTINLSLAGIEDKCSPG